MAQQHVTSGEGGEGLGDEQASFIAEKTSQIERLKTRLEKTKISKKAKHDFFQSLDLILGGMGKPVEAKFLSKKKTSLEKALAMGEQFVATHEQISESYDNFAQLEAKIQLLTQESNALVQLKSSIDALRLKLPEWSLENEGLAEQITGFNVELENLRNEINHLAEEEAVLLTEDSERGAEVGDSSGKVETGNEVPSALELRGVYNKLSARYADEILPLLYDQESETGGLRLLDNEQLYVLEGELSKLDKKVRALLGQVAVAESERGKAKIVGQINDGFQFYEAKLKQIQTLLDEAVPLVELEDLDEGGPGDATPASVDQVGPTDFSSGVSQVGETGQDTEPLEVLDLQKMAQEQLGADMQEWASEFEEGVDRLGRVKESVDETFGRVVHIFQDILRIDDGSIGEIQRALLEISKDMETAAHNTDRLLRANFAEQTVGVGEIGYLENRIEEYEGLAVGLAALKDTCENITIVPRDSVVLQDMIGGLESLMGEIMRVRDFLAGTINPRLVEYAQNFPAAATSTPAAEAMPQPTQTSDANFNRLDALVRVSPERTSDDSVPPPGGDRIHATAEIYSVGPGYYKIFGIPQNADQATIEAAYKGAVAVIAEQLRKGLPAEQAQRSKRMLQDMYDILSDPALRAVYDTKLAQKAEAGHPLEQQVAELQNMTRDLKTKINQAQKRAKKVHDIDQEVPARISAMVSVLTDHEKKLQALISNAGPFARGVYDTFQPGSSEPISKTEAAEYLQMSLDALSQAWQSVEEKLLRAETGVIKARLEEIKALYNDRLGEKALEIKRRLYKPDGATKRWSSEALYTLNAEIDAFIKDDLSQVFASLEAALKANDPAQAEALIRTFSDKMEELNQRYDALLATIEFEGIKRPSPDFVANAIGVDAIGLSSTERVSPVEPDKFAQAQREFASLQDTFKKEKGLRQEVDRIKFQLYGRGGERAFAEEKTLGVDYWYEVLYPQLELAMVGLQELKVKFSLLSLQVTKKSWIRQLRIMLEKVLRLRE